MGPVVIFHGPPNAGKSSQAKILAEKHGGAYVSSGDLLRSSDDPVIMERMRKGMLARSEDIERIMKKELFSFPPDKLIVIDGFPRMINEFHVFEGWLEEMGRSIEAVYEIAIPETESYARADVRGRHDDAMTIERWRWYREETAEKVLVYCEQQGWLKRIDGVGTVNEVAARVEAAA